MIPDKGDIHVAHDNDDKSKNSKHEKMMRNGHNE